MRRTRGLLSLLEGGCSALPSCRCLIPAPGAQRDLFRNKLPQRYQTLPCPSLVQGYFPLHEMLKAMHKGRPHENQEGINKTSLQPAGLLWQGQGHGQTGRGAHSETTRPPEAPTFWNTKTYNAKTIKTRDEIMFLFVIKLRVIPSIPKNKAFFFSLLLSQPLRKPKYPAWSL